MTLSGVTAQYWNGSFTFAGSNDLNLGTGNVTLGASLTVTVSSNRLTVNGPIGDNGQGYGLTKAGTGTLALGGSSGYSGGTTINAGTLELDANAAAQNSPVTVNVNNGLAFGPGVTSPVVAGLAGSGNVSLITTDSSAVVLNVIGNSTGLPYYGNLTGPGGLAKTGSGTLILAGSNSYTGATTVSGGTLQIGTGGSGEALAISTTSIADNAALVVDCYGALPLSAAISGTGSLTKAGAGALTLSGGNSYTGGTTLSGGVLQFTADSAVPSTGAVTINSGAALALAPSGTYSTVNGWLGSGKIATASAGAWR